MHAHTFIECVRLNRCNAAILDALPDLGLPDAMLVGGCLFQTVWNVKSGKAPDADIKDYDLFYFDASDLSAEAETAINIRIAQQFADLGVEIEVANQARVHLWYESHFGQRRAPLRSVKEGVDGFLMPCTCVGISVDPARRAQLYAPHGLEDLYNGVVRLNPWIDQPELFARKAASYLGRWPWLRVQERSVTIPSTQ